MLELSSIAKLEKNKLISDGAWIILLEICVRDDLILRLCRNTEDIQYNGHTWVAFPFEIDDISHNGEGSLPRYDLKVSNVTRALEGYLEEVDGGVNSTVNLYVVVASPTGQVTSVDLHEVMTVQSTSYDENWVTFTLSGSANLLRRVPERRFLKLACPFVYKGPECKSTSSEPTCDKTLAACRLRSNAVRYGGEPAIPQGGIYVRR